MVDTVTEKDITVQNAFEALLFSLKPPVKGMQETFAINVFKIREVFNSVPVTRLPCAKNGIVGMISLRGEVLSVVDLANLVYNEPYPDAPHMMVTEFAGYKQVFLIHDVSRIIKIGWDSVKPVDSDSSSLLTGVAQLAEGRLVSLLDVEQILSRFVDFEARGAPADVESLSVTAIPSGEVFFVDDSLVARKQVEKTLQALGVRTSSAVNGAEAWSALQKKAEAFQGEALKEHLSMILTDVEMPEMDGYQLARKIKADSRFAGIPVVMYSSLTHGLNADKGKQAGADHYVQKFDAKALAEAVTRFVTKS